MKNRIIFVAVFLLSFFWFTENAFAKDKQLSVVYMLNRLAGRGSNQLAVWIENAKGEYVATLFATKFTADGGYDRRPASLKNWIAKSHWSEASRKEIDAVTGSTQTSGMHKLIWDGCDRNGVKVPDGLYVVKMEANIRDEDMMFAEAPVMIGGKKQKVVMTVKYNRSGLEKGEKIFEDAYIFYQ